MARRRIAHGQVRWAKRGINIFKKNGKRIMIRNAYGCRMALMFSVLTATLVKNVLAKSLLATLVTLLLCAGAQAK